MKYSSLVVAALLLTLPIPSRAQGAEYAGTQVMTVLGNTLDMSEAVSLNLSAVDFWIPSDGTRIVFAYLGPSWNVTEYFWLSPQIGYAGGWTVDGADAFILALSGGASLGPVDFYTGANWIGNSAGGDYFGVYRARYGLPSHAHLGLQAEQVNRVTMFGPHVSLTKDKWTGEFGYYVDVGHSPNRHAFRITNTVSL